MRTISGQEVFELISRYMVSATVSVSMQSEWNQQLQHYYTIFLEYCNVY
jgi:hypothetical protein